MSNSKFLATIFTVFVCAMALTIEAGAQGRGGGGGGSRGGGGGSHGGGSSAGRAPSGGGRGPSAGQAAPRGGPVAGPTHGGAYPGNGRYPVYGNGRYPYYGNGRYPYYGNGRYPYYGYGRYPYYGYGYRYPYYGYGYAYPYYGYGYPYYYGYPGFSFGVSFGYSYPYYYGYPYYPAYSPPAAYVVPSDAAYGGVKIQGAPRSAEVYVDGTYAGVVDDFDGTFQRLDLQPGQHEVEVRTQSGPRRYDVSVGGGQTVTIHVR